MPKPNKPSDLIVTNGWYFDIPTFNSPHFETLSGMAKNSGSVAIVDAGANVEYNFPSQIVRNGQITLTRPYQGTPEDVTIEAMVEAMQSGLKINCSVVKMHHNQEIFRLLLEGFRIHSYKYPDFDVNAESKFIVTFEATVDKWTKLPV